MDELDNFRTALQDSGSLRLKYRQIGDWPPLAWLARCQEGTGVVQVTHGPRVEVGKGWFCEAVWPGDFQSADFDRTDLVFGSGGRLRPEGLIFVSAGSTVDRLQWIRARGGIYVSNSLVCLLSWLDGTVDPAYPNYLHDFRSIVGGLGRYKRTLSTSVGPVHLTYYANLRWDGRKMTEAGKPGFARDFGSFERYRDFLRDALCGLSRNMVSRHRSRRYRMMGTLSSGYDSPTVIALARDCPLTQAISLTRSRSRILDDGQKIGSALGIERITIDRDEWRRKHFCEVPFLASDANGGDVNFAGAEPWLSGRVLLTGFHGDKVWSKRAGSRRDDLVRGDQSGLSLTEYRLWADFIHCPVPFMGARQIGDIGRLSRSPEMTPWDLGDRYSRPLCRRIVEEAGVSRDTFGVQKKAGNERLSARSVFWQATFPSDYMDWLRQHHLLWWRRGRLPATHVSRLAHPWQDLALALADRLGTTQNTSRTVRKTRQKLKFVGSREYLYKFLFPWALDRAKLRYGSPVSH